MADSDSSSSDLRIVTDSSDDDSYVEYVGTFPRGEFNDVAGNPGAINVAGYGEDPSGPGGYFDDDEDDFFDGPRDNYFYDEESPGYDNERHSIFQLWCGHLVIPRNCFGREGDELSRLWAEFRALTFNMRDGMMLDYAEFEPAEPLRNPANWNLSCEEYTALLRQVVADIHAARRNRGGPAQA
jgi:hypothetical protein